MIDLNFQPSNPIELSFTEELNVVDILNELIEMRPLHEGDPKIELLQRFVSEYKKLKDKYDPELADKVEVLEEEIEDLEKEIKEKENRIEELDDEIHGLHDEITELDSKCDLLEEQLSAHGAN